MNAQTSAQTVAQPTVAQTVITLAKAMNANLRNHQPPVPERSLGESGSTFNDQPTEAPNPFTAFVPPDAAQNGEQPPTANGQLPTDAAADSRSQIGNRC